MASKDPLDVIAECLGEPPDEMRNPVNAGYRCPFINGICRKHLHRNDDPVPVCSLYRGSSGRSGPSPPICICPHRFFEAGIVEDVLRECWPGQDRERVRTAHEVELAKFGKVDLVLAEIPNGTVQIARFLPVELQAVDITGSYWDHYSALIESRQASDATYGFNWANVRKRFITQLVSKGAICSRWETKIVAVVQQDLFDKFQQHARFTETNMETANIVFLLYQYHREAPEDGAGWTLRFQRAIPTTHSSLMTAVLYERVPDRADFERKILSRLD